MVNSEDDLYKVKAREYWEQKDALETLETEGNKLWDSVGTYLPNLRVITPVNKQMGFNGPMSSNLTNKSFHLLH